MPPVRRTASASRLMLGTISIACSQSACATPFIRKPFCISTTMSAAFAGSSESNTCSRPRLRTTSSMTDWGIVILCMSASGVPANLPRDDAARELMLAFGRSHDQSIERGRHLDLAGQPAVGLELDGEVQHLLFHVLARQQLRQPLRIDIDMAGGAGARPAAIGIDARDAVLDRA